MDDNRKEKKLKGRIILYSKHNQRLNNIEDTIEELKIVIAQSIERLEHLIKTRNQEN